MLHIGKTGGTAMKYVFSQLDPALGTYDLTLHRHVMRLPRIQKGHKVFFVVRDPVDRFVSGFNSRLREGRPRYYTPWTPAERLAFRQFRSPDSLGRALSSEEVRERAHAYTAMSAIRHVRDSYWDWFVNWEYMQSRVDDILLILWLPDLTATFPRLRDLLGLPETVELPSDDLNSHRSPADVDRHLSDVARTNLERWYGRDYAFIDLCAALDCFAGPSRQSIDVSAPATQPW
ncbi:MAG TPA: sulfotransferase family 2 domain-containing protein [Solirubrobacteraceae bacterium]|nr:sulfotransferase family 2 domain-containing protein [Solirubrobacteraceae bacterium]